MKALTIKKGKHKSFQWPRFYWNRDNWQWGFVFTNSCKYPDFGIDTGDYNKLVGVGFLPWHHKYSIRLGWRCYDGELQLALYAYQEGQRIIKEFGPVIPNKKYKVEFFQTNRLRGITISDEIGQIYKYTIEVQRYRKLSWRLGFYFGGNKPAPQDVTVLIQQI